MTTVTEGTCAGRISSAGASDGPTGSLGDALAPSLPTASSPLLSWDAPERCGVSVDFFVLGVGGGPKSSSSPTMARPVSGARRPAVLHPPPCTRVSGGEPRQRCGQGSAPTVQNKVAQCAGYGRLGQPAQPHLTGGRLVLPPQRRQARRPHGRWRLSEVIQQHGDGCRAHPGRLRAPLRVPPAVRLSEWGWRSRTRSAEPVHVLISADSRTVAGVFSRI